jgi:hypothetical protein
MLEQPGDFRLVLRPLKDATPAIIRLRHALKHLLRAWNLRCVEAVEVPAAASSAAATAAPAPAEPVGRPGSQERDADASCATLGAFLGHAADAS